MKLVEIIDDVLDDPLAYRARALQLPFGDIVDGQETWHGIAVAHDPQLPQLVATLRPTVPVLSFFRHSPKGQREPNYIHADALMGDWTAILYLNPDPPAGDGTVFWQHKPTGTKHGEAWREDGKRLDRWEPWLMVPARFNRLALFYGPLYHSRALEENYGEGDQARLIQVVFAKGGATGELVEA